jgi:hypothetical protein
VNEEPDSPEIDDVRRLLAEARHTGPMPDDVATRMDAVLADLARTPGARSTSAPPSAGEQLVSLAAHRRRRAAGLLVAAAAIVVGGVVVAQQLPYQGSSASSATAGGASDNQALGNTASQPNPLRSATTQPENNPTAAKRPIVVHPQHFSADALAARGLVDAKASYSAQGVRANACIDAPAHSVLLRAVFRHAPAVLVYHRPAGSTQVVDLFVCGTARPLKSVTLPTG